MATRWLRIGGGLVATATLSFGVWWGVGPEAGLGRWLARSWTSRLEHESSEQIASDLRYIAALDAAGLDTLLEALGSTRSVVAVSAAEALQERLKVWRQWPAERSGPLAQKLARGLAERVGGWPATSQRVAADVALQLLNWPIADQRDLDATLLVDCERILRIVPMSSTATSSASALGSDAASPSKRSKTGRQPGLLDPAPEASPEDRLPKTAPLPEVVGTNPTIQPAVTEQQPADSNADHGLNGPLVADGAFGGLDRALSSGSDDGAGRLREGELPELVSALPDTVSPEDAERIAKDLAAQKLRDEMAQRSDLDLIYDRGNDDPKRADAAEAELRRRGFRHFELKLADKFISPDPAERRQVAHLVQGLTSGASRWLIWLSFDPDRSVRQAAVALMFTAEDPQVQQRLLKMEVTDQDRAICERIRVWRERR